MALTQRDALIGAAVVIGVNCVVYCPYMTWAAYKYWQHREHSYIRNRRYTNALFIIANLTFFLIVNRTLYLLAFLTTGVLTNAYLRIFISNLSILLIFINLTRMWVLFYDHTRNKQLLAYKWKSELLSELRSDSIRDPSYPQSFQSPNSPKSPKSADFRADSYTNQMSFTAQSLGDRAASGANSIRESYALKDLPWTIRYERLGNLNLLYVGAFLLWSFSFGTSCVALFLSRLYDEPNIFDFAQIVWTVVAIGAVFFGFYKINKCQDELGVRYEFMQSFGAIGVFVLFYLAVALSYDIFSYERVLLLSVGSSLLVPVQGYILAVRPLQQLNKHNEWVRNGMKPDEEENKCLCSKNADAAKTREIYSNPLSFSEILGHEVGFELFTSHLVLEYAVENMLFLLEVEIIKDEILKYNLLKEDEVGYRVPVNAAVKNIKRPKHMICRSYFNCLKNFQYLIQNYIRSDSKYCVNLSSSRRKKLLRALDWIEDYLSTDLDRPNTPIKARKVNAVGDSSVPKQASAFVVSKSSEKVALGSASPASPAHTPAQHSIEVVEDAGMSRGVSFPSLDASHVDGIREANADSNNDDSDLMTLADIMKFFDFAVSEVYSLLRTDSMSRFTSTQEYIKFYAEFSSSIIAKRVVEVDSPSAGGK